MLGQPHAGEKTLRLLSEILLLSASVAVHAASFDCAKARTPQEKAICASPELSKADDEMAAGYRRAFDAIPAEMRDLVRGDQREWLGLLPKYCPAARRDRDQTLGQCLLVQYQPRIKELQDLVQHKGGVTFVQRTIAVTLPEKTDDGAGTGMEAMPGYATLEASWLVAVSNLPEWQAWNKAVLDAAQQILVNDTDSKTSANSHGGWPLEEFEDNTVEVTLGTVSPDLVMAHVEGTWWRGAHPSENYIELNWLLKEKRPLKADDMFRAGSGWQQFLYDRCDKDLHEQLDTETGLNYQNWLQPGKVASALQDVVNAPENWRIDASGLGVVFPEYAVAPRAMHPEPVTIPWPDLKTFLQPGFQPPAG
jgi:uncharacterized protein